jgi:hypothetical protein
VLPRVKLSTEGRWVILGSLTYVGELAILENQEFMLIAKCLQLLDNGWVVVLQDVNMCLIVRPVSESQRRNKVRYIPL